jgi:hypothetical protein
MDHTMTKKEMFTAIMNLDAVAENAEMVEFLQHQIDLLDSRKRSDKPTAKQTANESIKDLICEILGESETPMRVKDMIADERLSDYSSSKITALLRQMLPDIGDGRVIKTIEKKVSYFSLA